MCSRTVEHCDEAKWASCGKLLGTLGPNPDVNKTDIAIISQSCKSAVKLPRGIAKVEQMTAEVIDDRESPLVQLPVADESALWVEEAEEVLAVGI